MTEIPQLKNLRKFPHVDTMLSDQVKINSLMNQISRADRHTSKLKYLIEALRTDITNRLRNGYKKAVVASCVLRYQAYQKSKDSKLALDKMFISIFIHKRRAAKPSCNIRINSKNFFLPLEMILSSRSFWPCFSVVASNYNTSLLSQSCLRWIFSSIFELWRV